MGEGSYRLGEQMVEVSGGVARLGSSGKLAGSTLTMDAALGRAVRAVGLPIAVASRAAAGTPAAVLGARTGALAAGLDADLVVLDDELAVVRVMRLGRWQ